jgi:hypothetical protein
VILAEGLACESHPDTGNRAVFANTPAPALHPRLTPAGEDAYREAHACAKLVVSGPTLDCLRRMLDARASERDASALRTVGDARVPV